MTAASLSSLSPSRSDATHDCDSISEIIFSICGKKTNAYPTKWKLKKNKTGSERTGRFESWRRQASGRWNAAACAKGKHGMSQYQTPMPTHTYLTRRSQRVAADKAASNKEAKYRQLANSQIFVPVATETAGTWNHQAMELVQDLGRRSTAVTEDTREASYLFQRLSVALQRRKGGLFYHRLNAAVVLFALQYFTLRN